jgi:UDP-N-acetylmuramoyl-L-alanyl-D-glutamate--2,6-diaminopimelate ligase
MNEIENDRGIKIVVDFAHTPNALKEALQALRPKTKGRLIAVFGSAGARDVEKRGLMGEISAKFADITVITAEDPRGELEKINAQILAGAQKNGGVLGKTVFIEGDRQKAIHLALNELAKKGDTVGMFGKGHEKSMNYDGKIETPWSDHEAVKKALK